MSNPENLGEEAKPPFTFEVSLLGTLDRPRCQYVLARLAAVGTVTAVEVTHQRGEGADAEVIAAEHRIIYPAQPGAGVGDGEASIGLDRKAIKGYVSVCYDFGAKPAVFDMYGWADTPEVRELLRKVSFTALGEELPPLPAVQPES